MKCILNVKGLDIDGRDSTKKPKPYFHCGPSMKSVEKGFFLNAKGFLKLILNICQKIILQQIRRFKFFYTEGFLFKGIPKCSDKLGLI